MIGGVAIIASIIGTFAVRTSTGNVERALYRAWSSRACIAAAAFAPITYWLMRRPHLQATVGSVVNAPSWGTSTSAR